jgi:hypothetical protein
MNKKADKLQAKFDNTLKILSNKIEASKLKQEQILTNFEQSLAQKNKNLEKVSQQIKPKNETIAVIQNAVNLTDQQFQVRDEALELTQAELKTAQATAQSLVETHREYVYDIHQKIDH